jgi:hypothetical protein
MPRESFYAERRFLYILASYKNHGVLYIYPQILRIRVILSEL